MEGNPSRGSSDGGVTVALWSLLIPADLLVSSALVQPLDVQAVEGDECCGLHD